MTRPDPVAPRRPADRLQPTCVVVGGGLAGLAAAVALADRGFGVTLVDARPRLGGRAASFPDPGGEWIDNCQHVSMGCCTNLADFCHTIGIDDLLTRYRTIYFRDERGHDSRLHPWPLPAPLHLGPSFALARHLSWRQKIEIGRGVFALLRDPIGPAAGSFADWLTANGQSAGAVDRFWALVLTSALNESLDRIDYRYARQVVVQGMLENRRSGAVDVPRVPLGEFYGLRLTQWLTEFAVDVRSNQSAAGLEMNTDGTISACRLKNGTVVSGDYYILATPFDRVAGLLPPAVAAGSMAATVAGLAELETAPITSVHLWYDRPVMELPHLVGVGRTIHWLFRRDDERPADDARPSNGRAFYVQAVTSASRELAALGKDAILDKVTAEVAALLPRAAQATLVRGRVVTERNATFSVTPGVDRLRPPQATPLRNLWLAGDYTRTGWPATMEGAVRSGYLAAEGVLTAEGRPGRVVQPDLPVDPF
ncbi:MAG: hydroxysqualene dehydroxylase HpnE [Planctomycetia bacterium]